MMPMYVWFFKTCRMRLDDAVRDLLTSWGRIQVCGSVCVCVTEMLVEEEFVRGLCVEGVFVDVCLRAGRERKAH